MKPTAAPDPLPLPRRNGRPSWVGAVARHLVTLILCFWALWVHMRYRLHGNLLFVLLPWVSVVVLTLKLVLVVRAAGAGAATGGPPHPAWTWLERGGGWLLRGFVYGTLILYVNGALDGGVVYERESRVITTGGGDVDLGVARFPYRWALLQSWDRADGVERVLLQPFESPYIWGGQDVVLQLHPGLLGLPWIESIEHDEGKYYAAVLAKVPGARLAHQRQVYFYLHRRRTHDAARATRAYLERYPDDYAFAKFAATGLGAYGHYEAMAMVLEPFAARRANYEAVALGGFALGKIGRKAEAIRLLETAIAMEPENWWGYYFAGYAYGAVERYADAVNAFERSQTLRPGSPEVQAELGRMRQLKAAHEAAAARRAAAAAAAGAVRR